MKIIASFIFGLLSASACSAYGQWWREIKPIESTVGDVKRLLGDRVKCVPGGCEYTPPKGGKAYFEFSTFTCKEAGPGTYWDVPLYTVISVRAHNPDLSLSDLGVDESKLFSVSSAAYFPDSGIKIDEYESLVYESRELGMKIETGRDKQVVALTYFPATRYDKLFCPPAPAAKPKPPAGRR